MYSARVQCLFVVLVRLSSNNMIHDVPDRILLKNKQNKGV